MTEPAPPLKPLTATRAKMLITRVNRHADQMGQAIAELFVGQAWLRLGYESWDALAEAEFGPARESLGRVGRRAAVGAATEAGVSGKAIASALGISMSTVSLDKQVLGLNGTVLIFGEDGRETQARGGRPRGSGSGAGRPKPPAVPWAAVVAHVLSIRTVFEPGSQWSESERETVRQRLLDVTSLIDQWNAAVGLAKSVVVDADD